MKKELNKGIYTTTFYQGRWIVMILEPGSSTPKQVTTTFADEEDAKHFMTKFKNEMSYADNKAFMLAKHTQEVISSGKLPNTP